MKDFKQLKLFHDSALECSVNCELKTSSLIERKQHVLNLHLHNGFPTEGKDEMPLLSPYNGKLPERLIPFSERNKDLWACGVHCYLHDYTFNILWSNPSTSVSCLQKYSCVTGPDFSLFVDQPRAVNIIQLYKNRWATSYLQSKSVNMIPSASWGNVDSFGYCFDGLPENSIIAIGHNTIGRDNSYKKLYKMGVEALIERKKPTKLLVYGAPLDFIPNVEIVYYEGYIQKLREL